MRGPAKKQQFNAALHPTADRLLVRQLETREESEGGIIIASQAQEKPQYGVVVSVGEKVTTEIKPFMIVAFGRYAGTPISVKRAEFLLMRQEDVLAFITDPKLAKEFVESGVAI